MSEDYRDDIVDYLVSTCEKIKEQFSLSTVVILASEVTYNREEDAQHTTNYSSHKGVHTLRQ